mgnify:CR=1 FL=1
MTKKGYIIFVLVMSLVAAVSFGMYFALQSQTLIALIFLTYPIGLVVGMKLQKQLLLNQMEQIKK